MKADSAGLKPYAISGANSRGREHPESLPAIIDPFALDRQRVLRSAAFRRLVHKTQVFVAGLHDHFRTRLTHTLEVASIARRLCVGLQVNDAVGELIALTHDLGHPPFGHAGEVALRELMAKHGGFEHNAQSLRVVEYLEHPYPPFRGLNLSYETRESLAKHCTLYDKPGSHPLADGTQAPIEGQIANLADRIAYDCHDLEDGLGAGLIDERGLNGLALWKEASEPVRKAHPDVITAAVRRPILDRLEGILLESVVVESRKRIAAAHVETLDDVRGCGRDLVAFTPEVESRLAELEKHLRERLYRHPKLIRMDAKARRLIAGLFEAYLAEPRMLPTRFARRIEQQGAPRVICDYIAGMTDRFCQEDYRRMFQPFERM